MNILIRSKLLRTIKTTLKQFLTLVLIVGIGVVLYISAVVSYYNINQSHQLYKKQTGFADYVYQVTLFSEESIQKISKLSGILEVTHRMSKDIQVANLDSQRNINARFVSYSMPLESNISGIYFFDKVKDSILKSNSNPSIYLENSFALANGLRVGDTIDFSINDQIHTYFIEALVGNPEFMWPIRNPINEFESTKNYAIVYIPQEQLETLFASADLTHQILVKVDSKSSYNIIDEQINKILASYGLIGSYSFKESAGEKGVQVQLEGLKGASNFLPIIFFIVELGFLFTFLTHLIKSQRLQIGILKALGFQSGAIVTFYTLYCFLVTLLGTALGILIGGYLSSLILLQYSLFLNIPLLSSGLIMSYIIKASLISIITGVLAGLMASWSIVLIQPAEAMKAKPPKFAHAIFLERIPTLWAKFSETWKISLRSLARNKPRFFVMTFGIAASIMLITSSMLFNDSKDALTNHYFKLENQYSSILRLDSHYNIDYINKVKNLNNIIAVEPLLEVVTEFRNLSSNQPPYKGIIIGLTSNSSSKNIFDHDLNPIQLLKEGIVINEKIADSLDLHTGDLVEVSITLGNGISIKKELPITDINMQYVGLSSYMNIHALNELLGTSDQVNGAYLSLAHHDKKQILKDLSVLEGFDSLLYLDEQKEHAKSTLQNLILLVAIITTSSILLGFAIIYNTSVSNLKQRSKEMAILKFMGFHDKTLSNILLHELILECIIGISIGLPFGKLVGSKFIDMIETDIFKYPTKLNLSTNIIAVIITIIFILGGHLLAMKKLKSFDFAEELKNYE